MKTTRSPFAAALALVSSVLLSCSGGSSNPPAQPAGSSTAPAPAKIEPAAAPSSARPGLETPGDAQTQPPVYAMIETSMGDIVLALDPHKAPISVENFLSYVDQGFYDGTIFHRVMSTFMIQGGGFTQDMTKKEPGPPITNEWRNGLTNQRGTIAMARTNAPDSATCQFFINVKDNPNLDRARGGAAYAVFGRVVAGMDVVDAIKMVETGPKGGHANVPILPVTIEKLKRLTPEKAQPLINAAAT